MIDEKRGASFVRVAGFKVTSMIVVAFFISQSKKHQNLDELGFGAFIFYRKVAFTKSSAVTPGRRGTSLNGGYVHLEVK